MKIYFLIGLCCSLFLGLSAQRDLDITPPPASSQLILKYAPTSLLNPLYPAIHIAGEYKTDKKAWQFEAGYLLKHHLLDKSPQGFGSWDSENKGFFLKGEYRTFFRKAPVFYFAPQIQVIFNNYKRTDTFDGSPQNTPPGVFCSTCIEDTYSINKRAFGLNFKLGYQKELLPRWVFDAYIGLGLNYLNNEHSHNEDLHRNPAMADSPIGYYLPHYPGSYIYALPTMAVGIKVGYRLDIKN